MSYDNLSDRELVAGLLEKDDRLFSWVTSEYYNVMYATASAIAGNVNADEIIQEAWISAIRALEKFQFKSSLKTWLVRIVANEAKSKLRKESRLITSDTQFIEDALNSQFDETGHWTKPISDWGKASPEELLMNNELKDCIERRWSELPESYQSVMNLKELDGVSIEEICNLLDLNASNVRVIVHRSRNKLLAAADKFQRTGEC